MFKYQTQEEFTITIMTIVFASIVAFLIFGIAQTMYRDMKSKKGSEKVVIWSDIQHCYDYQHRVVYKCYIDEGGNVVVQRDKDGNNIIVSELSDTHLNDLDLRIEQRGKLYA